MYPQIAWKYVKSWCRTSGIAESSVCIKTHTCTCTCGVTNVLYTVHVHVYVHAIWYDIYIP